MIIKVWSKDDKIVQKLSVEKTPTYTIEVSDEDAFDFGKAFGEGLGKSLTELSINIFD